LSVGEPSDAGHFRWAHDVLHRARHRRRLRLFSYHKQDRVVISVSSDALLDRQPVHCTVPRRGEFAGMEKKVRRESGASTSSPCRLRRDDSAETDDRSRGASAKAKTLVGHTSSWTEKGLRRHRLLGRNMYSTSGDAPCQLRERENGRTRFPCSRSRGKHEICKQDRGSQSNPCQHGQCKPKRRNIRMGICDEG
jgi:hypothetical protein